MIHAIPISAPGLYMTDCGDPIDHHAYALERIHFAGRTRFQSVCIADTTAFGRALFLDGHLQSAASDEGLYHQHLVHPAMIAHGAPREVLIIGSGEGAGLREVLAHRTVERALMVDLDGELVDLCREHLPSWCENAFDDPRTDLLIADAGDLVARDHDHYDVIIVDLTDMMPGGPAGALYSEGFFRALEQRLKPGGVVAVQAQSLSHIDSEGHRHVAWLLRRTFQQVHAYTEHIPSFLTQWSFLLASHHFSPRQWSAERIDAALRSQLGERKLELSGAHLLGRFALPPRLAEAGAGPGRPIPEAAP